ncbi:integrase, catalytic region, zinc finger, CCHC-type containing protein [Tanacetum coccineum]
MENRENGRMILNSVQNGPLIWPTVTEENGTIRTKKYEEVSATKKIQADCDCKATNIVLQGLPPDVYAIVNHHKVAKEIWDKVKLLMQGTKLSLQETECKLYDEFDKFTFVTGETLYQYYWRFAQLINNMNFINMSMRAVQVNTKFLNSLPPEWSKFVTDVKLARDLHTTNYDQLLRILMLMILIDDVSNAKAVLMANLSNYGSDVISKVPHFDSYHNDIDNQSVHAMQNFKQTPVVDFSNNEITSDSNIIPLSKSVFSQKAQRIKPTCSHGSVIYDKHVDILVIDDEETLILEEVSRSKISEKKDPEAVKQKISLKPIDYIKLNQLSEDFGKRFVPQQELSAEQAFWFRMSNPSIESFDASHVKVEDLKELPKVILVNKSLKKFKFYLAKFDNVVKKRTTPNALTEEEDGTTRTKKYEELSATEKIQADCDCKATNIILQGLPPDVYAIVNHHKVQRDLGQNEYESLHVVRKGETLYQYYWRFAQLINNMNVINMSMRAVQVNTKFLNSLPPEWSKFVTDVKLARDLHTTNYDQLYPYLEQHEVHANETRLMRERYQDPLAFVVNYNQPPPQLTNYHSQYNPTHFPQQTNNMIPQVYSPQSYSPMHPPTHPSQPQINHSSILPLHPYQSQLNHQTSYVPQIAYHSPQASTQPMTELPLVDSGFVVLVFNPGDDLIACLNKAITFLTTVASSMFPSTNNQLITSSNPRNQATIQDGRVTVQQVQGRQGQSYSRTGYKGNDTNSRGNNTSGLARVMKCYNCQGKGHMARQCTQPKRLRNVAWLKDKVVLAEAQEAGQILDEEQLAFLADSGVPNGQVVQTTIPNNVAFQTEDLDTYDSDCDDVSNAKAVLMANLSSYGFDVLLEVPHSETYHNYMDNQSVHAMQDYEQTSVVVFSENEITSDSNIISYSQYLLETQQAAANQEKNNESITAELERYKERFKTFEQRLNVDLSTHEKMIDSQMDDMIKEKLALKQQIDSLEQNLSNQIKEKESLLQIFTVLKNESKEKENKYMENEIDLEKKINELDNIVYKVGQSAQTVHMLTKP